MNNLLTKPFGFGAVLAGLLVVASLAEAGNYASSDKMSASTADKDIVTIATEAGQFETLTAALKAAGLVDTLQGDGPFTVFAPTDAAFDRLPESTVETLLKPENRDKLTAILTYHVVPGKISASEVVKLERATTVNGSELSVSVNGKAVKIDDADVVKTDINASNGIIHVIDSVILPSS